MTCQEESVVSGFTNNGTVSVYAYIQQFIFLEVYQVLCDKSNKGNWPVVKVIFVDELNNAHIIPPVYITHRRLVFSCNGRKRKFAVSKLYVGIVSTFQELIAIHINLERIASALVFQT